jgi:predicted amidohydrolase YtcJ
VSITADLLFVREATGTGTIWTGAGLPQTDAVAVHGGRIVALGHDALELRAAGTEVVPVRGSLLPAFRDGHLHPLAGGVESLACDLVDAPDVDACLTWVRRYVDGRDDDGWVLGYGYPPEILPGGIGRADVLDAVVADRPVALWSSDHHMVWVNSRALDEAGIGAGTADPARGTVVRDDDGHPVGTLLEEAEALLTPHLPVRGRSEEARGLRVGLERMVTAGIVWGQDAWTTPDQVPSYERVADAGELTADLDLSFKLPTDGWREQLEAAVEARLEVAAARARRVFDGVPGGRLTATTVKLFVDGVIEGGTGALLEPYCAMGDGPHDHGIANWSPAQLAEVCAAADAAGFQLHMHAIGDAAVRSALDAVAHVEDVNGPRDRRPVVAHTHLVHPDDRPRFRALGAVANFEPLWAQPNAVMVDLTEPRLGRERSGWQYPIGTLLRSGAHVSFGSDWPVSSHVPLEGLQVALTRRVPGDADSPVLHPDERITLDQGITAYTLGTAYQAHDEADAGTITVGARADLVLTDEDVTAVPADALGEVTVTGTWRAGMRVCRPD